MFQFPDIDILGLFRLWQKWGLVAVTNVAEASAIVIYQT